MTISGSDRRASSLGRDFNQLWVATTASQAGSAVAYGALPMVAILALDASTFQVSLLSALAGVAAAAAGIGLGPWIEFRRKRPTMIGADLVRFAARGPRSRWPEAYFCFPPGCFPGGPL